MERLQKLLAQAGIASRRHAEEMILAGRIRVNGKVVDELGVQADPAHDTIMVDNHPVAIESKAYYILNKPRGYISDRDDTSDYKTALDLVPDGRRLFAAGRLDMMSEGMLFLTNDGELANRLTHPRYEHEKEYLVLVFGVPDDRVMERLVKGIMFDGEWMRADSAERAGKDQEFGEAGRDETWLRIILHEGKKRQIRHMCASLGHPVKRLIRVRIGPLKLGATKVGEWRKLSPDELALLRKNAKPRPRPRRERSPQRSPGAPQRKSDGTPRAHTETPHSAQDSRSFGKPRPSPRGPQRSPGETPTSLQPPRRPQRVGQAQPRGERPLQNSGGTDRSSPRDKRQGNRSTRATQKSFGRPSRKEHGGSSWSAKTPDAGKGSAHGRVGGRSAQRNNRAAKPGTSPDVHKSNFKKRKS